MSIPTTRSSQSLPPYRARLRAVFKPTRMRNRESCATDMHLCQPFPSLDGKVQQRTHARTRTHKRRWDTGVFLRTLVYMYIYFLIMNNFNLSTNTRTTGGKHRSMTSAATNPTRRATHDLSTAVLRNTTQSRAATILATTTPLSTSFRQSEAAIVFTHLTFVVQQNQAIFIIHP